MPGNFGAKYVYTPKHIETVLTKIRETGRPDKLTNQYMKDLWLLKDAKYSAVLDILKDMGFLDSNGVPTELYAEYQNEAFAKKALAKGVKNSYPELFKAYPTANTLPTETIRGYFKQLTGAEKDILNKIVSTFIGFCKFSDFSAMDNNDNIQLVPQTNHTRSHSDSQNLQSPLLPITMNIQIVIPSEASSEQYDKIFASIKKFLTP